MAAELFNLTGKVALVTGGSKGLGKAMARGLAESGADIAISSRHEDELKAALDDILKGTGRKGCYVVADMSQRSEATKLAKTVLEKLGRIDILINNAGATWGAPAEDYPLEAWDKVMNLNIRSLFLFAQAVGKAWMIPNKGGRIINLASIAGLSGSLDVSFIAYGTSKGAAVNFTRTLAGEWGKYGITVNAIAPGFFPSKMTKGVLEHFGADKLAAGAPLKRLGDDDDLKGAVLLFASAAGKHITGQILAVDGGVSAVHGGG